MRRGFRIRRGSEGFSLLELLIVVGIFTLLVALLMPAISAARKISRSTSCLANLQQWGQSYQMYRGNNRESSLPPKMINQPMRWWELLSPYINDVRAAMLCPEATQRPPADPRDPTQSHGSANMAWWAQRGDWLGSYGLNYWICRLPYGPWNNTAPSFIRWPAHHTDQVPLLGDCCWAWSSPGSSDSVPRDLNYPEDGIPHGMAVFCIDRHRMATNIVFLDGHAEHVPLALLWKLRWSETFVPRDVSVPRP